MKHLLGYTIYGTAADIPGEGTAAERLMAAGADGIELLTGYQPVPRDTALLTEAVHLPYATDWYGVWSGRLYVEENVPEDTIRHMFYGRSREGICDAVRECISQASSLEPDYAVLHAGNANTDDLLIREQSDSDTDVLKALTEVVNDAVSRLGGEPPMRILFENLWWPGLRMTDAAGYRVLEKELEFEDWGLCLDTGHLLVSLGGVRTEEEAIDLLLRTIDSYPEDMIDRIGAMHLHLNTSAEFMRSHRNGGEVPAGREDRIFAAYDRIYGSDSHDPFTSPRVRELVEAVRPDTVTHEMKTVDPERMISDFICQRSLFG